MSKPPTRFKLMVSFSPVQPSNSIKHRDDIGGIRTTKHGISCEDGLKWSWSSHHSEILAAEPSLFSLRDDRHSSRSVLKRGSGSYFKPMTVSVSSPSWANGSKISFPRWSICPAKETSIWIDARKWNHREMGDSPNWGNNMMENDGKWWKMTKNDGKWWSIAEMVTVILRTKTCWKCLTQANNLTGCNPLRP